MMSSQDPKDIPHLIIKKVARASQKHMEEFVKQFGSVDSIYYGKTEGDYPNMFVVYTREANLNKAYVSIREKLPLYEPTLKAIIPKTPTYCIECMKKSFYFCESCSAPYCSEVCQKKSWPDHAVKCVSIPKLVQMQWKDYEQKELLAINIADRVVVVGYLLTGCVTVRPEDDKDNRYENFLDDCNAEAERSPAVGGLAEDFKVWARFRDQWYRARVEKVTSQQVTVNLLDLNQTEEFAKEKLRQLKSKDLFFKPNYTRSFRLKSLHQKDVFSALAVRTRIDHAIAKKEKFTVTDTANNFIDLQLDGTAKSFNQALVYLYERTTGIVEEEETLPEVKICSSGDHQSTVPVFMIDRISFPTYAAEMATPPLYVFDTMLDELNCTIFAFHMKYGQEMQILLKQLKSVGKALFKTKQNAPNQFEDIEFNQLVLLHSGKDEYDRCAYKSNQAFESVDTGRRYQDVELEKVRYLPRELISQSYLMVLILDDDYVDNIDEARKKLEGLKNKMVKTMDTLVNIGENQFRCLWKTCE